MRKQFTIFLILVFVLGLVPVNFSTAITQNQIDAEVQIVCTDGSDNWFSGSGTIIDPKGIILTNRHVVEGAYMNTCFIGFIESISQEPNFGTAGNYNLAEVKYQTVSNDMDAAILYLDNPTNKIYPYINIWNSNSDALQFGDKIEVIGFPSIGGSTITYTSGDFSGFGSNADGTQNYIKTTLPINHGNSGGAAYNPLGAFVGMPTFVLTDINSISYILSVNSIKNWLSGILGNNYQQEVIEQKPIIEKLPTTIQSDITPPDISKAVIDFCEYRNDICYFLSYDWYCGSNVSNPKFTWSGIYDEGKVKGYYVYFGKNLNSNPTTDGSYININSFQPKITEANIYYLIIQAVDNSNNISDKFIYKYLYDPNAIENYGINFNIYSSDKKTFYGNFSRNPYLLSSGDDFYIEWDNVDEGGYYLDLWINKNYVAGLGEEYGKDWGHISIKEDFTNQNSHYFQVDELGQKYNLSIKRAGFDKWFSVCQIIRVPSKTAEQFTYTRFVKESINKDIEKMLEIELKHYLYKYSKITYEKIINNSELYNYYKEKYIFGGFPIEDVLIGILYDNSIFLKTKEQEKEFYADWTLSKAYGLDAQYEAIKSKYVNKINIPKFTKLEINAIRSYIAPPLNYSFIDELTGLILLKVEKNGEAYYIYPEDNSRYYLGRPADAFSVMRKLGLGATHEFINSYTIYPDHVLGKILIDVEQNGEAYYIYPKDKKAYYLGRPADAFRIMRELGLGITDSDLNKIPEGSL
ncbi:serine protease [Candidatus Parcubacteria bacterium]|nr:serine protease [Candidatus Parcubacteria bacterium]